MQAESALGGGGDMLNERNLPSGTLPQQGIHQCCVGGRSLIHILTMIVGSIRDGIYLLCKIDDRDIKMVVYGKQ